MSDNEYNKLLTVLEEIRKTTRHSNEILRKMRRDAIIGQIVKLTMWAFILGFPVYLYYHYKPVITGYVDQYQKIYNTVTSVDVPFIGNE